MVWAFSVNQFLSFLSIRSGSLLLVTLLLWPQWLLSLLLLVRHRSQLCAGPGGILGATHKVMTAAAISSAGWQENLVPGLWMQVNRTKLGVPIPDLV